MIKQGGSAAARGIRLKSKQESQEVKDSRKKSLLNSSTGLIQNVYETRFITYLSRFLLSYDPAASAWWDKNSKSKVVDNEEVVIDANEIFAQFAESVEVGLADYFLGPYGSYASVAAAKAGVNAVMPAQSVRETDKSPSLFNILTTGNRGKGRKNAQTKKSSMLAKRKSKNAQKEANKLAKQGILNLFSLLSARYTSIQEKQQLAILFSLISNPELQPVNEIRSLLGEIDNGSIKQVELSDVISESYNDNTDFRLSSRQGGGYSKTDIKQDDIVAVESPPPLGDEYKPAKIIPITKPTTRILRIKVIDGGSGYTVSPEVIIKQPRGSVSTISKQCETAAIIDRNGSVSEIIVLDPGYGYGGNQIRKGAEPVVPTVEIRERKSLRRKRNDRIKQEVIPAKAIVELEYKIVGVNIVEGGSGYLLNNPPKVLLNLPKEDPDWFATPKTLYQTKDLEENQLTLASVTQMSTRNGDVVDTRDLRKENQDTLDALSNEAIMTIQDDPIALLPSSTRPQFSKEGEYFSIPSLPAQSEMTLMSSKACRSIDPLFGGIGKAPVTKNALTLSGDQYLRLALSGAICTVLVRTALNPLELVKTKIQLQNDEEIIKLATEKAAASQSSEGSSSTPPVVGTTQVVQSLIEVRGPLSLFQSADITFITSVVFGLFGFGATELFRRSFSAVFFNEDAGPNEFLFLAAAGLATLLTCAAGAPFEILRVRSMSTTENQGVAKVFDEFVEQNRLKRGATIESTPTSSSSPVAALLPPGLQTEDIKPLWSSFNPIVSRELPFAVTKFLVFDLAAGSIANLINSANLLGDDVKIQVGVGGYGLLLSAFSGAIAGIAGALVSHPADLILTLTSASSREEGETKDWRVIVKELLAADGGITNLFAGFPARAVFFFLVIGLQFFLYDYIKTLLDVGTDDLTLVLDVFYAIRQGL